MRWVRLMVGASFFRLVMLAAPGRRLSGSRLGLNVTLPIHSTSPKCATGCSAPSSWYCRYCKRPVGSYRRAASQVSIRKWLGHCFCSRSTPCATYCSFCGMLLDIIMLSRSKLSKFWPGASNSYEAVRLIRLCGDSCEWRSLSSKVCISEVLNLGRRSLKPYAR